MVYKVRQMAPDVFAAMVRLDLDSDAWVETRLHLPAKL